MVKIRDAFSPISTSTLKHLSTAYMPGQGASRMLRPALVDFIISTIKEEELALLRRASKRRGSSEASHQNIYTIPHRTLHKKYGDLFKPYLHSRARLDDPRFANYPAVIESDSESSEGSDHSSCSEDEAGGSLNEDDEEGDEAPLPQSKPDPVSESVQAPQLDTPSDGNWPQLVSEDTKRSCISHFRSATELAPAATCAVCARRTFTQDLLFTKSRQCRRISKSSINLELLKITDPHIAARSSPHFQYTDPALNGLAIDRAGVHITHAGTFLDVCCECQASLAKNKLPALALANDNIRGFLPPHLQDVTWLEERLCAVYLASAYVIRLYDLTKPGAPEARPRTMKGHTCSFPLNTVSTASKLPWTLGDDGALLSCIVIGPRKPRPEDLRRLFKVRKKKVLELLDFLRRNFQGYPQVATNTDAINALPDDDIPELLMRHVVYEARQEVPSLFDIETTGVEQHPGLTPDDGPDEDEDGRTFLEHHGVVDINGVSVPAHLRSAAALSNATGAERPDLIIRHGTRFIPEYNNPTLFPGMFPTLFPWGTGGFELRRRTKLSFARQAKYLLDLADPAFRRHWSYIFVVANIKQRRAVHIGTRLACKTRDHPRFEAMLRSFNGEAVKRVADHLAAGGDLSNLDSSDARIYALLKKCELVTARVPGSKAIMTRARADIQAFIGQFGIPQLFLTLNPGPTHSPVFHVLYGDESVDLAIPSPRLPNTSIRAIRVADDPVAASDYFHFHIYAIFKYLLGWDVRARRCMAAGGIFGRMAAFLSVKEHTMRGQLHCHTLIWLEGGLNPADLRQKMANSESFVQQYLAFFDDIIKHDLPKQSEQQSQNGDAAMRTTGSTVPAAADMGNLGDEAGPISQGDMPDHLAVRNEAAASSVQRTGPPPSTDSAGDATVQRRDSTGTLDQGDSAAAPSDGHGGNERRSGSPTRHVPTLARRFPRQERPPLPSDPGFWARFVEDWRLLGEEVQRHRHTFTCFKNGRQTCRFLFPHSLVERAYFDAETNSVWLRVGDAMINWHNDVLLVAIRHNMDVKAIQSGKGGVAAASYVASYATKSDETPANQISMIRTVYDQMQKAQLDTSEANGLLSRCAMQFGRLRQLHAQQASTYVRDLGDCFQSHKTMAMLSGSLIATVRILFGDVREDATAPNSRSAPDPAATSSVELPISGPTQASAASVDLNGVRDDDHEDEDHNEHNDEGQSDEDHEDDSSRLQALDTAGLAHQVQDYIHRGDSLQALCFYDFVRFCTLTVKPKRWRQHLKTHHRLGDNHPNKQSHCHFYKGTKAEVPRPIISKFPRRDGTEHHGDTYCVAMMAHFIPFSHEVPLKSQSETWEQAFQRCEWSPTAKRMMDNWAAINECSDARDAEELNRRKREANRASNADAIAISLAVGHDDAGALDPNTEADMEMLLDQRNRKSAETLEFVATLKESGWFTARRSTTAPTATLSPLIWSVPPMTKALKRKWGVEQSDLEAQATADLSVPRAATGVLAEQLSFAEGLEAQETTNTETVTTTRPYDGPLPTIRLTWNDRPPHMLLDALVQERNLTPSQRLAFVIAGRRFFEQLRGLNDQPLRLLMHGEAGTGKTVVVRLLRELMDRFGCGRQITFVAPTGKAAAAIGGMTVHAAFAIEIQHRKPADGNLAPREDSARKIRYLQETFKDTRWLFLDEVSMTSCELLAQIDKSLRIGTGRDEEPFGGVNVLFAGDLCQLPPVASSPLYVKKSSSRLSAEHQSQVELGRTAWAFVDEVVEFTEQMRMQDEVMAQALRRLRVRQCTDDDVALFNSNVLRSHCHPVGKLIPANRDVIILARTNDTVRTLNQQKATTAAENGGQQLAVSYPIDKSSLSMNAELRSRLLSFNGSSRNKFGVSRIPLYHGMPVVYRGPNQSVPLGITNGAFGTLQGWHLTKDRWGLTIPTGAVVCFDQEADWNLTQLPPGSIPVYPTTSKLDFQQDSGATHNISRRQLPLQPGFAMTVHSAQGITSRDGIAVDLSRGGFEAYVAASRATRKEDLFLLKAVTRTQLNTPDLPESLRTELDRLAVLARSTSQRHDHSSWRLDGHDASDNRAAPRRRLR